MSNLPEIKKYIEATENTRKITQAMQLVAATKMKRFQKDALSAREFAKGLLSGLELAGENLKDLPYSNKQTGPQVLFVVITSDKGLCGSLNAKVLQALLSSRKWKETLPENRALFTLGRKSYDYFRRRNIKVAEHFGGISEELSHLRAFDIISKIVTYYLKNSCSEVVLVATQYINPFLMIPKLKTYLPFNKDLIRAHAVFRSSDENVEIEAKNSKSLVFIEPNPDRVNEVLAINLIHSLFTEAFLEFKAAEYSSRMVAMKKATEAADELIDTLKLSYNKSRQAKITQELAELSAGTEAMADELTEELVF